MIEHPDNILVIESDDEAGTYTVKRGGQTMLRYTTEGEAQAFVTGYAEGFMRNVRLGARR